MTYPFTEGWKSVNARLGRRPIDPIAVPAE